VYLQNVSYYGNREGIMTTVLYQGKNCPCPADCSRHGKCKECIAFHHARNEPTYCEYLKDRFEKKPAAPDSAVMSGKELRLLNYGPCAG